LAQAAKLLELLAACIEVCEDEGALG